MSILGIYLLVINLIGLIIMGYDKGLAKFNGWRISEKSLFTIAFIGGAIGVYAGMKVFHHKTKHLLFIYGVPILIAVNLLIFYVLYRYRLFPVITD